MSTGFRKLEWDCERKGCFNKKKRLDFEHFYDLLPRDISFSDVDGICEINGHFLLLEWKDLGSPLKEGTKKLLYNFCKIPKCTAFVVWGDSSTMYVEELKLYCNKDTQPAINATKETLFSWISSWGKLADENKQPTQSDFKQ